MKKQDFNDFIKDKKLEKLSPLNEKINIEMRKFAEEWAEEIGIKERIRESLKLMADSKKWKISVREKYGYSPLNDYERETLFTSLYTGVSFNDTWSVDEALEKALATLEDAYQASDEVIALRKKIDSIDNEFAKISGNLNALSSSKKRVEFLVGIGFDETEIYKYDTSSTALVLAEIDKSLVM
jgi:hypothetical protein